MGEKSGAGSFKIKFNGVFDLNELFSFMKDWYDSYGYDSLLKKHSEEKKSTGYVIEYSWSGEKETSDYVKQHVSSTLNISKANIVFVKEGNKKIKKFKGDIQIKLDAEIETDYYGKGMFGKRKFIQHLYEKYIFDKGGAKKLVNQEIKDYYNSLKVLLGLTK